MPSPPTDSVRKTLARSPAEIEALRTLWEELATETSATVFQRFGWNILAAEIFGERLRPLVAAVESDRGAAIIPACINVHANRLELLGECLFDYRNVLHRGDGALLQTAWQMLSECHLPLFVTALQPEAAESSWAGFAAQEFARAPWVDVGTINERDFRAAHSRAGSRLRKLQRKGASLREYSGAARGLVRRVYELKCDQFPGDANNIFRSQERREFMIESAAQEGERCQVFTLEDDAECIVAGLVTFLENPIRRFYTIYFDPHWAQYSPGVALVFEVTARSLAEGLSCDYMTGEYPYKLRFANASRMLYRVEASAEELAKVSQSEAERRIA